MKHVAGCLAALTVIALLGGCASRYCKREAGQYEHAKETPPLKATEGLSVPEPDPNLSIPNATGPNVKYASAPKGRKGRESCLDAPPQMPKEAAQPTPAAEPAAAPEGPAETDSKPSS